MIIGISLFVACILFFIHEYLSRKAAQPYRCYAEGRYQRRGVVTDEERRELLRDRLPMKSNVDFPPDPNSQVNYWLQVYGEMQRDLGDIWELTGEVNMPFTREEYLKFNERADRLYLNMERLAKLFYRCEGKDLIKGLK